MRHILLGLVLGIAVCGGGAAAQSRQDVSASAVEIEQAIQNNRLVNGMTLREAGKAMGVKAKFTRRAGVKVATWMRNSKQNERWIWSAEVDEPSATIWQVRGTRQELRRDSSSSDLEWE